MPTYIGPYQAIQPTGEGGPVYHPGDNVPSLSAADLTRLRNIEGYRFEDDPPTAVSPYHHETEGHSIVVPPNEMGVPFAEVEDEKKSKKD